MAKKGKPKEEDYIIGKNIKLARTANGLSQQMLADGIGISFQQVQKYEKGTNRVSASTLLRIAQFMRIHPMTLMEHVFTDNKKTMPPQIMLNKEILDMIHIFNKIKDERIRNSIRIFLKSVSSEIQNETD